MKLSILESLKDQEVSQENLASSLIVPNNNMGITITNDDLTNVVVEENESSELPYIPPPSTSKTEWFKWYSEVYLQSDHWQKVRAERLKLDGHRCRLCFTSPTKSNPLEVHHSHYDDVLYREHLVNPPVLITLCKLCHKAHHRAMRAR